MSFLSCRSNRVSHDSKSFAPSATLMLKTPSVENGLYVNNSSLEEFYFARQPYSSISIDEFSINAVLASGGNPHATYYASNDVDSVIASVDNLRKSLTPKTPDK